VRHNAEAEASLIGSVLLDAVVVLDICANESITVEHFHLPRNRTYWQAIQEMRAGFVDALTLTDHLKATGRFKEEDHKILDDYIDTAITATHCQYWIDKLIFCRLKRCEAQAASVIEKMSHGEDDPAEEIGKVVAQLADRISPRHASTGPEVGAKVVDELRKAQSGEPTSLPTPWLDFNNRTNAVPFGKSTCMAGTMGTRKSFALAQVGMHWAKLGIPFGYFCFEDGNIDTMRRMAAMTAGVSSFDAIRGKLNEVDEGLLVRAVNDTVQHWPIGWQGRRGMGISDIEAATLRGVLRYGWQGIILDGFKDIKREHLHNINLDDDLRSNGLCNIADRHGIACISVHHITKAAGRQQKTEDHRLSLEDLKGSGGILNDARMVWLWQCKREVDLAGQEKLSEFELECAKSNNGKTGAVDLKLTDKNIGVFVQDMGD